MLSDFQLGIPVLPFLSLSCLFTFAWYQPLNLKDHQCRTIILHMSITDRQLSLCYTFFGCTSVRLSKRRRCSSHLRTVFEGNAEYGPTFNASLMNFATRRKALWCHVQCSSNAETEMVMRCLQGKPKLSNFRTACTLNTGQV
jgi:hypothetical protein